MDGSLTWSREAAWSPHPTHVGEARSFVLDCLADGDLLAQAHAVSLVVSELATNVVLHANTPFTVVVARRDGWLILEVRDRVATHLVVPAVTEGDGLHGRGLQIVRALSESWGVWPRRDGKSVWAAFDLQERAGARGHSETGVDPPPVDGSGQPDGAPADAQESPPPWFP